jgi:ABC-2 type transport system permease protein
MKLLTVAKREYLERVRKRSFLIGTLLGPLLMGAMIIVPGLLFQHAPEGRTDLAVVDLSGAVFEQFAAALDDTLPNGARMFSLRAVPASETDLDGVRQRLNAEVRAGAIEGYLVIPPDIVDAGRATYFGKKVSNIRTIERIESGLSETIVVSRLAAQGLDYARVSEMVRRVKIETVQVLKGAEKASEFEKTYITTFIFIMMLYMTILLWGMAVQRSIIDEKNNRVIEVLLSSLTAFDLMAGKIVGVGAVGLTQYAIWAVFGLGISAYALSTGAFAGVVSLSPVTLGFFVLFYLLGFLFYSTLFAAVGAVCNTDQEAQQLQTPIVMCLAFTIVIPMAVMQSPEGAFATVFSMIPFFAPILMFMRINILMPPAWQIALSIAILLASIYGAGLLAAKIFRVGILMYGKRPDAREILKWLRRA